jgi:hypothetical protein
MEVDMKMISRVSLIAAAAATTIVAAAPAMADNGRHRGHDGIDAGDVIAGALIIGGIAAVASAASRGDRGYDRRYDRGGYDRYDYGYYRNGYGSRVAVEQCVRAAERDASRFGRARITDVTSINRIRGGYEVRGRLVVAGRGHWARGYDGWDRYGYRYDRYGRDYDKGKFSCLSRFGSIQDVRLSGLRGSYY